MPNLAIAILAAGASSRMGQPKQLLLFRGKTLVQRAVEIAVATGCTSIYVVVNPEEQSTIRQAFQQFQGRSKDKSNDASEDHQLVVDERAVAITLLVNESYALGISTSIRLATKTVFEKPEIDGLMFLNCDQPFLTAGDLSRLIGCYEEGKIIASLFAGTIGSPAIFHRDFFNDLLQLSGDVGARSIIKKHREQVVICEMTEAQFDVDTPEDYKALLATSEKATT